MGRYISKTNLIHNNVIFPPKTIVELSPEEAKPLLGTGAVEATREEIPETQESKPVERFSAPTSVAEVEKAVSSATLLPSKRGKCPKCKVEREIKNPQVSQNDKGYIHVLGECAICGTKISRSSGRVKIEQEK